ncbi:MAG: Rho termination factor N-terminal domain-containing protein, partial [Solirubrobacterales bacterium]
MNATSLQSRHLADLHELAADLEIEGFRKLTRDELIEEVGKRDPDAGSKPSRAPKPARGSRGDEDSGSGGPQSGRGGSGGGDRGGGRGGKDSKGGGGEQKQVEGLLEITSRGHGFIRLPDEDADGDDVYISPSQIRRCELESGDRVSGPSRPPRRGERHPALVHVDQVNGTEPGEGGPSSGSGFDELTPVAPHRRLPLDGEGADNDEEKILLRSIDLLAPLARGQRVLVDAAVGSGRTTLLRALARSFEGADDLEVSVVLVDERPEEEAAWRKAVGESVELAVAGADMRSGEQMSVVERAVSTAKRRAAGGDDVVVLVDSLSRLGVAAADPSKAKPIFACGRETEEESGGSLTVIATTIDRDEDRGVAKML